MNNSPSRNMPRVKRRPKTLLSLSLLIAVSGLIIYFSYQHYVVIFLLFGLIAISYIHNKLEVWRFSKRLATRKFGTEAIGQFAHSFDCRQVDTWVIRAVYEQIQEYLVNVIEKFPLEPSDRLIEDLKIDREDLDDIVEEISQRTGRSNENNKDNPYYSKVVTVGDLVMFFNNQPLTDAT